MSTGPATPGSLVLLAKNTSVEWEPRVRVKCVLERKAEKEWEPVSTDSLFPEFCSAGELRTGWWAEDDIVSVVPWERRSRARMQ